MNIFVFMMFIEITYSEKGKELFIRFLLLFDMIRERKGMICDKQAVHFKNV